MWDFPFFPEQASTVSARVDAVFFVVTGLSIIFGLGVAFLIVFFAIRYRQGQDVNRSRASRTLPVEITWIIIPLILAMGVFVWAAVAYVDIQSAPANTLNIYIVGKQWMWHVQHPAGNSEINQLHVPINQPVQLIMTSQDVIHSFFIPAFRTKQDVLPGRYTSMWFEATKTGEYHLFCAEYCGTDHSRMIGSITVMEQLDYERWVSGDADESMAVVGERIFEQRGCNSCHSGEPDARGPNLVGLYGNPVKLQDGSVVVADEAYILESIVNPQARIVAGYGAIMPTYEGVISDEGLFQLVAYIKSLEQDQDNVQP